MGGRRENDSQIRGRRGRGRAQVVPREKARKQGWGGGGGSVSISMHRWNRVGKRGVWPVVGKRNTNGNGNRVMPQGTERKWRQCCDGDLQQRRGLS